MGSPRCVGEDRRRWVPVGKRCASATAWRRALAACILVTHLQQQAQPAACPRGPLQVKKVERTTNHDVKAIEYVLKNKFQADPELAKVRACAHLMEGLDTVALMACTAAQPVL